MYWYPSGLATSTNQSSVVDSRLTMSGLPSRYILITCSSSRRLTSTLIHSRACWSERVQRRRAAVVGHGVGVGGELEGDDVARRIGAVTFGIGAPGLPDHLELQQVGIGGSDLVEVGADAVRARRRAGTP